MANCPKCGYKLRLRDIKPECPKCGVNLVYYDMENRLEQDEISAEKEQQAQIVFRKGIKNSSVGNVWAIARLVGFVLALAVLMLPIFTAKGGLGGLDEGDRLSLMSIVQLISSGEIFSGINSLSLLVFFAGTILINFVAIVFSLFSFKANGLKNNEIIAFMILGFQIIIGVFIILSGTAGVALGFAAVIVIDCAMLVLHKKIDVTIKNEGEKYENI